jgi:hypothetical protein
MALSGSRTNSIHIPVIIRSAYEISYGSKQVQVPVLEILFDGEPITQSPIRLMVEEADCAAMYGEGSNREADGEGNCVCSGNTNEMGGICMESQFFYLIIFACVAIAMTVLVTIYLGYKKKQNGTFIFSLLQTFPRSAQSLAFTDQPDVVSLFTLFNQIWCGISIQSKCTTFTTSGDKC